jgi:hypothetical protein
MVLSPRCPFYLGQILSCGNSYGLANRVHEIISWKSLWTGTEGEMRRCGQRTPLQEPLAMVKLGRGQLPLSSRAQSGLKSTMMRVPYVAATTAERVTPFLPSSRWHEVKPDEGAAGLPA